jgi:hypothetical protein
VNQLHLSNPKTTLPTMAPQQSHRVNKEKSQNIKSVKMHDANGSC